jgi:hypothetical protein
VATKAKLEPITDTEQVVIDDDGNTATLKGFGWSKQYNLTLDPRIDMTKPIWEQVQKLRRSDKRASLKSKAAA